MSATVIIQGTGKIEAKNDDMLRYVHRVGSALSGFWREFDVCLPRQSLQLLKVGRRYMQDGQLWRDTENFVERILNSGYALPQLFPDFILGEDVARKLLSGSDLNLEDAQSSVVPK